MFKEFKQSCVIPSQEDNWKCAKLNYDGTIWWRRRWEPCGESNENKSLALGVCNIQ